MNRDPWTTLLAAALLLSVIATAALCFWYLQVARQLQQSQYQLLLINRDRALMQQFANEAVEYSRKNPALQPILQSVGIRARGETNPVPAPTRPRP